MPIKPTSSETEQEFISRCMSEEKSSFPDVSQRYAVCQSKWDNSMKTKDFETEIFVLKPAKNENRGKYLERCSKNNRMRLQYPNMRERLNSCLHGFNSFYKYWNKLENFAGVPEDSALGECIAREKAKGADYRTAYASCSTKVVSPSGPVVLSEDDNLLIEPVLAVECPPETQDIKLNIENRQNAIDDANYGPQNPNEPNEDYWKKKAKMFQGDITDAKKALCGNCAFFIQTKEMLNCIAEGIGGDDAWDSIDAGDLGFCEAFDFKCAANRTCDAWVVGGPITDNSQ
jgi:hypothetical protein